MTEALNPFEPPKHDEADEADVPRKRRRRRREYEDDFVDARQKTRLTNYFFDFVLAISFAGLLGGSDLFTSLGVHFGYYLGFETATGKSPAKWLTRTRVVTDDGRRPTFAQIFKRTLIRFVPFEPFSFLGRGRGWHDRWTKTRVVYDADKARELQKGR